MFFKSASVLNNSQNSFILAIVSWIIASLAVIATGIALIDIASVGKKDNLSIIGWIRHFNGELAFKVSKNFITFVYLPITHFFLPFYVILPLQDGIGAILGQPAWIIGSNYDWLIWIAVAIVINIYFMSVPTLFSKVGDWQNKIATVIKFIPLLFVIFLGIGLIATNNSGLDQVSFTIDKLASKSVYAGGTLKQVYGLGAGFGGFISVMAIFFTYDGFYLAAGVSSEMKRPEKTPLALFFGLGITTVIYITIAVFMSLNGGDFSAMKAYMAKIMPENVAAILFGVINILIAIGVLGIINNFAMWTPRLIENLILHGEIPLWKKFIGKLNFNSPRVGVVYSFVTVFPMFILLTAIGALGYMPSPAFSVYSNEIGQNMSRLYAFNDLISNWTSLFIFAFVVCVLFGAIRKHKETSYEKGEFKIKGFKIYAWFSLVVVSISLLVAVTTPFVDLILMALWDKHLVIENLMNADPNLTVQTATLKAQELFNFNLISRCLTVATLIFFFVVSFIPSPIASAYFKKKFGSLERYNYEKEVIIKQYKHLYA
nr:amino acid permease [Mycoplasmopsis columbinasalis]